MQEEQSTFRIFCGRDKEGEVYEVVFRRKPHWFGRVYSFETEDQLSKFKEAFTKRLNLGNFLGALIPGTCTVIVYWEVMAMNKRSLQQLGIDNGLQALKSLAEYYTALTEEYKLHLRNEFIKKNERLAW